MEPVIVGPLVGDIKLKKRLLNIACANNLSHLGSYFSSIDIIDKIYADITNQNKGDIFILSSGHCALSLYCVLEKYYGFDAQKLFNTHGGHPHYDADHNIHCSTGSLGMGITVAVGRALANPNRTVHCLISDGECAEGSVWEALRFIHEHNLTNIKIHVNVNGYCAYDSVDVPYLERRIRSFLPTAVIYHTTVNHFSFLRGVNAHYHVMSQDDYQSAINKIDKIEGDV